jgi:hypothetical protein
MDMTILMKVMSFIVFDLLSHLRSEVGMGLLDSRSVLISLMTEEILSNWLDFLLSVWMLTFQRIGEESRQGNGWLEGLHTIPSVFLCSDFARECGRMGRRALTRSVCCERGCGVQALGVGWEDRSLSCLHNCVCCHHPPLLQFAVCFVFDVLSHLRFWEWVSVMLAVISGPPHDQVLIIEARQIVWVCLPVNAILYFHDPCLSLHFC